MKYLFCLLTSLSLFSVEVKVKDISRISGIRDNQISGYGLVIGLAGTGDTRNSITSEAMKNYLKNQGLNTGKNLSHTRNIASVLITAIIPSTARTGDKLDITVSSIGDAKSLEGGVLVQSPLKAANGEIVAVASGVLSFGGKDNVATKPQNNPSGLSAYFGYSNPQYQNTSAQLRTQPKTVGLIGSGAIVEKEIQSTFFTKDNKYRLILENQDFSTLTNLNKLITDQVKIETLVVSPTEIEFTIPEKGDILGTISSIENLQITPDSKAKVVINERTGTIVMGANVTVDEVAISKQGISVVVSNKKGSDSKTELISMMNEGTRVSDIVDALNKIGASTKDIIAVMEGLKKSGALHAELIIQ
jgi:flagellar P-ring protein FlgI